MTVGIPQAIESMRCLIGAAFPDLRSQATEQVARAAFSALPEDLQVSVVGEVLAPLVGLPAHRRDAEVVGYYEAFARHARPGVGKAFTARLPMALIELGDETGDVETELGICFAGDRKFPTRRQLVDHYSDMVEFDIGRVLLLTPPRYYGARFGAIATYLLCNEHGTLSAYVLEAGMATGEPVVPYLAPDLNEPILRRTWYEPTPFSSDRHYYRGHATFEDNGSLAPVGLDVECLATRDATSPLVTVTVAYTEVETPEPIWPALLTAQAAGRVAVRGEELGKPIGGDVEQLLAPALAAWARTALPWEDAR